MKKNSRYIPIFGLILILVVGFMPLSATGANYITQQNIQYYSQSLPVVNAQPIESTLTPLTDLNDTSFRDGEESVSTDVIAENNTIVEFDLTTREYTVLDKVKPDEVKIDPTLFQPHEGVTSYTEDSNELIDAWDAYNSDSGDGTIRPTYIFGADNRTLVTNTTEFPFSSVVSIQVESQVGKYYIGSGAMIDANHVLTVGHIAYIHEDGGLVTSMELVPGRDGSNNPYGIASAAQIRMPSEWINNESAQHDWAVITLTNSLGSLTGWMGIATFDQNDPIYYATVYTAGYPGDLDPTGRTMYNTSDVGKGADYYNHWFALDTYGGQSGSAIWMKNATGRYIITILAYEYQDGAYWNFGTRINDDLYLQIATFLMVDASSQPNAELRSTGSGTTAQAWEQIYKRSTVLGIATQVENIGGITANNVKVGFYLSSDKNVTTDDYLVGTKTVTQITELNSQLVEWYGRVPKDVPNGLYYMGWIIDPNNEIPEYFENNNAGTVGNIQIRVTSTVFQDFLWSPLGTGLMIGAGVLIVLIPTIIIIVRVKKRKRNNFSGDYASYGDYQDPY